jgi:SnoaL-like domain
MAGRKLEIILGGLVDAVRQRDPEKIAAFLAPDLVWEAATPGLRCQGREEAMGLIGRRLAAAPISVDAIEAIEAGEHVVVGLSGPGFNQTPGDLETPGQTFFVFTFRDGQVVHWHDYRTRGEALAAAGAADSGWR